MCLLVTSKYNTLYYKLESKRMSTSKGLRRFGIGAALDERLTWVSVFGLTPFLQPVLVSTNSLPPPFLTVVSLS